VADRLHRRRLGIRRYVLPSARSLVHANSSGGRSVWVSTKFLRKYFKCQPDDELDRLLASRDAIIQINDLRCPHGDGLAPRVAQTGKLLSLEMYDSLRCLLRGERALLRGELHDVTANDTEIEDFMVGSDINMICQECTLAHRDALMKKLCRIRLVKALFEALDPKVGDVKLEYDETGVPETAEARFVHAIPRQLGVKFRRKVSLLVKSLAKAAGGIELDTNMTTSDTTCEGLIALNMSSIECENDDNFFEFKNFNESITCKLLGRIDLLRDDQAHAPLSGSHGNLVATNGRQVQYISDKVWLMIKELFPDSLELKVPRSLKGSSDCLDHSCRLCVAEKESVEQLRSAVHSWAKETKDQATLKGLLDNKRTICEGQDVAPFLNGSSRCRLMHKSELSTWREAIKVLSTLKRIKGETVDSARAFVETLLFPSRHAFVLEFETAPIDRFGASLRSFICREHHLVVRDAILEVPVNGASPRKLASYVMVVSEMEYQAYTDSLASLLCILTHDRHSAPHRVGNLAMQGEIKAMLERVREIAASHHPFLDLRRPSDTDPTSILELSVDGPLEEFTLSPSMCFCETCSKEYTPLLLTDKENGDNRVENISVGSDDPLPSSWSKAKAERGSGIKDPVLVESDMEDDTTNGKCHLRVFQVKQSASEEEIFKSLRDVSAIASDSDTGPEIRRSNRKRKQLYPSGVLLSEETIDVSAHYNMAAIFLLMFQSGIQTDFSKLFVVVHPPFEKPKLVHVTTFSQDLELTIPKVIGVDDTNLDIVKHVTLLYERNKDRSEPNATYVSDDLFHYSNIQDAPGAAAKGGDSRPRSKRKNRPSERGFQGTLLQGFRPLASLAGDGREVEDEADVIEGHLENPNERGEVRNEDVRVVLPSVVVDDSSEVSNRALSSSSPKREVSSDDENSEDERILSLGPTFRPSPLKPEGATRTNREVIDMSAATEDDKRDDMLQKLIRALGEAVGANDQERFGLAATMALSGHPRASENDFDELLASALGSYYLHN
jgi:hypothetical protein